MTKSISDSTTPPVQYIEPILSFSTKKLQIGDDVSADSIPVSELVKIGQTLLEFPACPPDTSSEKLKLPLKTGLHTRLSDSGNSVLSEVIGYPKVTFCPSGDDAEKTLTISVEPLFRLSEDNMKATLAIHPSLSDCRSLATEDLEQLIAEAGIVYGVDAEQVQKAKTIIAEGLNEFHSIPFALGQQSIPGEDAYLDFHIEIGPLAGRILKDGTIDFRERKIMVPISKGQIIATKIPATIGTPGITVKGEQTEAKPGKNISVRTERDARYSNETLQVTAINNGVLSVVRDQVIRVCSRQEIAGDINYQTGNVESRNCVIINGTVQPGFQVKTDGDLQIGGAVMSAQVNSLSNIVIKGGITGRNSKVFAGGDVDILFIEQGKIQCEGNCVIRKQCYYSTIIAGGDIRCKNNTVTIGGELVASGCITVGNIGSAHAAATYLAAGVVGERLQLYRELQEKIALQREEIIRWMQLYKGRPESKKIRNMEAAAEDTKLQLMRLNMIPGTGLYSRASMAATSAQSASEEYSDANGISLHNIVIEVEGTIHAGTKIQIGNRTLTLNKTLQNRYFKLTGNQKRILTLPLHRK
jgi:uncharacterized protein (DUF342 family)